MPNALYAFRSFLGRSDKMPKASAELGLSAGSDYTAMHDPDKSTALMMHLGKGDPVPDPVVGANLKTRTVGASDAGAAQFSTMPEIMTVENGERVVGASPARVHEQIQPDLCDSDDSDYSDVERGPSTSPVSSQVSVEGAPPPINAPRVLPVTPLVTPETYKGVLHSEQFIQNFESSRVKINEIKDQYRDNPEVQRNIFFPINELINRISKRYTKYINLLQDSASSQDKRARLEKVLVRLMARVIELFEILNRNQDNLANVSFEGWHDGKSKNGRSHINAVVIKSNGNDNRISLKTSVEKVDKSTPNYKRLDMIKMANNGEVCFKDQEVMPVHQKEGGPSRRDESLWVESRSRSRTPDSSEGADQSRVWGQVPGPKLYSSLVERQARVSGMPYSSQELWTRFGADSPRSLELQDSHRILIGGPVQARGTSGHPSGQPVMSGMATRELRSDAFSSHQPFGTDPGYQPRGTQEGEGGPPRIVQSPCGVTGFRSRAPDSKQGADQSTAWGEVLGQEIYRSQARSCTELYEQYSQQELEAMVSARSLILGIQGSHQIPVGDLGQAGGTSGLPSRQPGTSGMGLDPRSSAFTTAGSEGFH